jgi:hypothetical protein
MNSIQEIGVEAVVYGLPLVVMDSTMRVSTNVPGPQPNAHAPVNQFGNMSKYPSASDHTVVRMNIDTLYSWAWLDLSEEPIVLSVPDTSGRYYMMPMLDAWTNVFSSPGTRTTGDKAGNFAVTGPGWKGTLPEGVKEIKSPTSIAWIIGRTQTNGPKLATIGIVPGQDFDPSKLEPAVAKELEQSVQLAVEQLQAAGKKWGKPVNGWNVPPMNVGAFGTDYGFRAVVTFIGLGANLPADAIYPFAFVDGDGKPFSGANRYVVHFDKGQTPPANAFWSLTMYDAQGFPVENPINRYTISSWMPLIYNPDGSLDVYVQKDSPGKDKESNWLPASGGEFDITMRVYHPKPAMLESTWSPPPVKRVS